MMNMDEAFPFYSLVPLTPPPHPPTSHPPTPANMDQASELFMSFAVPMSWDRGDEITPRGLPTLAPAPLGVVYGLWPL